MEVMQRSRKVGGTLRESTTLPVLLALVLAAAGCNRGQQGPPPPAPPEVIVGKPVAGTITDYEEFTGHTEAVRSIVLRAMVTGYLQEKLFKEGDDVPANAPLFKIDPQIYQAQLEQAIKNLELARAHLKRLESDFQRAKSLMPTNAISQGDYDKAEGDRNEAAATVGVAEAARKLAQQNVDFTTISTPIAGRVSRMMIDPGNMVKANDTPLTSIVTLDKMYIYFDVDERTSPRVRALIDEVRNQTADNKVTDGKPAESKAGLKIAYGLADEEDFSHEAVINFVDNQIDSATGTLRLRAVVDNHSTPILLPYMFLRVRVPTGKPRETLFVPERALGSDQGQKFLFVIDGEKKAIYRKVTCGPLQHGMRAIRDGLAPTERFVVSGLQRVRAGDMVEPKEETPGKGTVATPTATAGPEPSTAPVAKRS